MASDARRRSATAIIIAVVLAAVASALVAGGIGLAFDRMQGNLPTYMVNCGVAMYVAAAMAVIYSLVQGIR